MQRYSGNTELLVSRDSGIVTIELNRDTARNALSLSLIGAVQSAIDDVESNADDRVVIIGATGKVFCAGHDLREIRTDPSRDAQQKLFDACSRLMLSLTGLNKPVIARVQGPATAAGCQLVATCDLAIASTDAWFATPGVNIGLFCSTPMVALSRSIGRKQAMEMLLSGEAIDAETAVRLGLINRTVAPEKLADETRTLAEKLSQKSPLTLAIGKEAFYRQAEMPLAEAYDYASSVMTKNMLTADAQEGIDAFLEKRPPVWKGI